MTDDKTLVYEDGWGAGYNYKYSDECPYEHGTIEYDLWMEGYHEGRESLYLDEQYGNDQQNNKDDNDD